MKPLTPSQLRALVAVLDGRVRQRFDARGNVFECPKGISPVACRKLQDMRLIEDVPSERGKAHGAIATWHKQRLSAAGSDALTKWGADLLKQHGFGEPSP